tara:strand:- start:767 stop:1402 length:636 start_codon:yes stop_codon:yes gene_type:complete
MHKTLLQALNNRYATKKFNSTKKISNRDFETLIESLRLTPTSYGLQLMKVVVVENKKIREELLKYSYNQKQVVDASHLIVLCREKSFDDIHISDYISNISTTRNIELEKLDGFKTMLSSFKESTSEKEQINWMNNQIYIALGNLLTSCAILGIDSCPMEGFQVKKYNSVLNLTNDGLEAVLTIPIGYSSSEDTYKDVKKVRRTTNDFLIVK